MAGVGGVLRSTGLPAAIPHHYDSAVPAGLPQVPTWLANAVTERWYMQALLRRLRRYTSKHGLAPPGT